MRYTMVLWIPMPLAHGRPTVPKSEVTRKLGEIHSSNVCATDKLKRDGDSKRQEMGSRKRMDGPERESHDPAHGFMKR